jgi:enediyne biosynthesis thioesterase
MNGRSVVIRAYEYRHIVLFEETNLVGNVYFANHVAWQGACREHFLRDHVPDILVQLRNGLSLITLSCQCDYLAELVAFDEIVIRMTLVATVQNRIDLRFDYLRLQHGNRELVAVGRQRIACMQRSGDQLTPIDIPDALQAALAPYRVAMEARESPTH